MCIKFLCYLKIKSDTSLKNAAAWNYMFNTYIQLYCWIINNNRNRITLPTNQNFKSSFIKYTCTSMNFIVCVTSFRATGECNIAMYTNNEPSFFQIFKIFFCESGITKCNFTACEKSSLTGQPISGRYHSGQWFLIKCADVSIKIVDWRGNAVPSFSSSLFIRLIHREDGNRAIRILNPLRKRCK